MTDPAVPQDKQITRDDIESKFRELQGEVDVVADTAVPYVLIAGAALATGVILLAFALGRRKGRKKSAIVEGRRL